jgi:hypothetical protein
MDNIKIWRRIDYRKPEYAASEAFRFLSNFNISLSEDDKHWFLLSSKENFDIGNQYFYEAKASGKKARYLKVNILWNDERDFSISEIQAFGK